MRVLAFDTSTLRGGVAVLEKDRVLASVSWERQGSHGELLTTKIRECLEAAGLTLEDVTNFAVGIGPGSFTGVRVSVNCARSLSFALGKRVFTFDTSELLAAGCSRTDLPVLAMINAHKNLIFSSSFRYDGRRWARDLALEAREPSQVIRMLNEPHLCLGDGYLEYRSLIPHSDLLVRDTQVPDFPAPMACLSLLPFAQPLEWKAVQALYLRDSGAEEKLREGRK